MINKVVSDNIFTRSGVTKPEQPIKLGALTKKFIKADTYELGHWINNLKKIKPDNIKDEDFDYYVLAGLKIAQNWRNQDMHIPTHSRSTDSKIQQHLEFSHDLLYRLFLKNRKIPKFPNT